VAVILISVAVVVVEDARRCPVHRADNVVLNRHHRWQVTMLASLGVIDRVCQGRLIRYDYEQDGRSHTGIDDTMFGGAMSAILCRNVATNFSSE
jgi:hypothetical protein